MIDRENVIYDIERCICHVPDACKDCSKYGGDNAIRCMEELLTDALYLLKVQEPGWISVRDRPPEEEGTYLVFRKEPFGAVTMAWYSGNENGWMALDGSFYADGVVTHYMPLPEPPKEET